MDLTHEAATARPQSGLGDEHREGRDHLAESEAGYEQPAGSYVQGRTPRNSLPGEAAGVVLSWNFVGERRHPGSLPAPVDGPRQVACQGASA